MGPKTNSEKSKPTTKPKDPSRGEETKAKTQAPKSPSPKTPAPKIPAPKTPAPKIPAPPSPAPKTPAPKTPASRPKGDKEERSSEARTKSGDGKKLPSTTEKQPSGGGVSSKPTEATIGNTPVVTQAPEKQGKVVGMIDKRPCDIQRTKDRCSSWVPHCRWDGVECVPKQATSKLPGSTSRPKDVPKKSGASFVVPNNELVGFMMIMYIMWMLVRALGFSQGGR